MSDPISLDSKGLLPRLALVSVILVSLVFGWVAVKWQMGNMLATLTQPTDPNASAIADLAVKWAPADPSGYWLKGGAGDDSRAAIGSFEDAVRLAPNDYRWRVELARAFEQDDQPVPAEREFAKAVQLAPAYGAPHWHFGNFLLRQNRAAEALNEFKKAADDNAVYREQVFSLAWDYFEKDAAQLENLAGERPEAVVNLAYFFASRGRAADSIRVWNRLSDTDKTRNAIYAKSIADGLFSQRHFAEALEFTHQLGLEMDAKPESVTNPSFEKSVAEDEVQRFAWQILHNEPKIDIAFDSKVKHQGNRSLKVNFKSFAKASFSNILQTVIVQPGARYRLTFWVRTENLKSSGAPMIDVLNANDDTPIARSPQIPVGTNEWQQMSVDFAAPDNCNGITIRTIRFFCGDDCPLNGVMWYDDFEITRL